MSRRRVRIGGMKVGGQKSEVRGRRAEGRDQRAEGRDQMSFVVNYSHCDVKNEGL